MTDDRTSSTPSPKVLRERRALVESIRERFAGIDPVELAQETAKSCFEVKEEARMARIALRTAGSPDHQPSRGAALEELRENPIDWRELL